MRTSCLINNYNYGAFVTEAIESALKQTVPFDEIIVVDDGSTDGSVRLLTERYQDHPRVRLLLQPQNQGQLACLNEGFRVATGDLVCFLDSDDQYTEGYLERLIRLYRAHPGVDAVSCAVERFGQESSIDRLFPADCDLGYSAIAALYAQRWVGGVTSTLSMRRSILEKILPVPFLQDWKSRADDCLVWGSSIAGARKYYLAEASVRYRVHGQNGHYSRTYDASYDYRRQLQIHRLFAHFRDRLGLHGELRHLSQMEFRTLSAPTFEDLREYVGLLGTTHMTVPERLRRLLSMGKHYALTRVRKPSPPLLEFARA